MQCSVCGSEMRYNACSDLYFCDNLHKEYVGKRLMDGTSRLVPTFELSPRDKLVRLAGRILMTNRPPSPHLSDHAFLPARIPSRWWRWLCGKLFDSGEERKEWARELREIADSLPKE